MFHFDIETTEEWLRYVSAQVPLDVFVALGSLLDEIVGPIPGYLTMGVAGAFAAAQGNSFWYVLYLALIAGTMKMIVAYLYYFLGDKLEDLFRNAIEKYLGISREKIEAVGQRFTGKHWQDGGVIFLSRAIPMFPALPFSLAAGIFRMDIRVYLMASFLGATVKAVFYVFAAYYGAVALTEYWKSLHAQVQYLGPLLAVGVVIFIGIAFYQYRKKTL